MNIKLEQPIFVSKIVMDDIYRLEVERLKTFEEWPLEYIDKNILAQTGMFYTRVSDKVKCYFCEVEIGSWEESDDPVREHIKWSANCPLLRRRTTNNIPIDEIVLERILPPASYDVCGNNDAIEIRPAAYPEDSISSAALRPSSLPFFQINYPEYADESSSVYQIYYPEYAIEAVRFRSFNTWPISIKQKPKELAEAGFFYLGIGDGVTCFSCNGSLKDWEEDDKPWEQHARWFSECRYLKLLKGQYYIDIVLAKYNQAPKEKIYSVSMSSSSTPTTSSRDVDNELVERNQSCNNSDNKIISEKACKICYTHEYNTTFLPCGHIVACAKCASSVTKCPSCRKPLKDVIRVYFS